MNGPVVARRNGRRGERGVSLGELLAVMAIIALAVAVTIPLVAEQVRTAKIRAAADNFSMTLKAARMVAVTQNTNISVTIALSTADPGNFYSYTDRNGDTRTIQLPEGVDVKSSTSPITFLPNGSLQGSPPTAATTVMEAKLTGSTVDRWTVTTAITGLATVKHERVTE